MDKNILSMIFKILNIKIFVTTQLYVNKLTYSNKEQNKDVVPPPPAAGQHLYSEFS